MIPLQEEIGKIVAQIIERYNPIQIILFGSCAKGCITNRSDIDLCIICEYEHKQEMLTDMLIHIESDRDLDLILYRLEEWEKYKVDPSTFAYLICSKGVELYGRYSKV